MWCVYLCQVAFVCVCVCMNVVCVCMCRFVCVCMSVICVYESRFVCVCVCERYANNGERGEEIQQHNREPQQ